MSDTRYDSTERTNELLNGIDDRLCDLVTLLQTIVRALPACESCKKPLAHEEQTPEPNPFASEIHGDNTPCLMCGVCRYSAAQDI